MEITNLTLSEISDKLKYHVIRFFTDSEMLEEKDGLFQESIMLYGEEVQHLIPSEHQNSFDDSDGLNCASGFIRFISKADSFRGKEYTAMLLYTQRTALFLYLQEQDNNTHNSRDILLKINRKGLVLFA